MNPPYRLHFYETQEGKQLFYIWLMGLKERQTRTRILTYLDRVATGNFNQVASVGDGVQEIKVNFGPGFRVYFAIDGNDIILLLTGGDKSTQTKDIEQAKQCWHDYKTSKGEQ